MKRSRLRMRWLIVLALTGLLATAGGPAPVLAGAVLYTDDFEADTVGAVPAGWNVVSGTWVTAVDGTQVMKETNTSTATAKSVWGGTTTWTDYGLQADVKIGTTAYGTSNVMAVRYKDDNNSYALILKDGNSWYLGRKANGVWTTFKSGSFAYNTSSWYHLELDAAGNTLTAFINGSQIATATDSTFTTGAIDFMSRYVLEVDNVTVTALSPPPPPPPSPSPSPTPTPSPSASPSPNPSPSASPSATPTPNPSPTPSPSPTPVPSPSPSPTPSTPSQIGGTVTDATTGLPIAGASVSTVPATTSVSTDASGSYTLNIAAATYAVVFGAGGYNSDFAGGVVAPPNGSATVNIALFPVPAGVAMDTFNRPDQNGLGTASDGNVWSNDLSVYPPAKASIVSRQAFVQTATQFTDHDTWMGIPYRDEEVSVDMNMVNVVQDPSFQHGGRVLARVQGIDIWLVMALNPSNSTLTLWVDAKGNWTQIGGVSQAFQVNTWYHAKMDVIANTVYGKAWLFGSPEPGWQVTGTQSSVSSPGVGGLRCGAADVYFENFNETPITQISGTVTNATTGSGLAGVTVNLSNGTSVVTDSSGKYVFPGLAAGTYSLSAAQNGFNPGSTNATVSIGQSAINVALPLTPIAPTPSPVPSPTPGATPTASPTPHG